MAALITSKLINRDPNNPGFLITKWIQILNTVGSDWSDDVE